MYVKGNYVRSLISWRLWPVKDFIVLHDRFSPFFSMCCHVSIMLPFTDYEN